jgi:hypothetical protein
MSGKSGWNGMKKVPVDGKNWPLEFAAKTLGCSERDLRDLVRIVDLQPTGTMPMAEFRRSGRNPRVYDAAKLVRLYSEVQALGLELGKDLELSDTQDED